MILRRFWGEGPGPRLVVQFLKSADVGIDGVRVAGSEEHAAESTAFVRRMMQDLPMLREWVGEDEASRDLAARYSTTIEFRHGAGEQGEFLPLEDESRGTMAYLSLFSPTMIDDGSLGRAYAAD
jgi:hypothetical protein